jgi:cysteine sulfinate desulfinase/cysteine desulfurase-like protein
VESESHVLEELGLTEGFRTVRFSFSHTNTREEIERVVEIVVGSV